MGIVNGAKAFPVEKANRPPHSRVWRLDAGITKKKGKECRLIPQATIPQARLAVDLGGPIAPPLQRQMRKNKAARRGGQARTVP